MKKRQIAPKPWKVEIAGKDRDAVFIIDSKGRPIASLYHEKNELKTMYSNASLMVAAPELYDKLKEAAYEFCHNCLSLRLDREEDIPMSDELIEKNCPLADNGCFCRAWWALLKKAKGGAK
jgi:hypothetical protein